MKKIVIIGGMAAGCKTAARLKRLKPEYEITIIEKHSFLSFGTCGMPFFAAGEIDDFNDLTKTAWGMLRDKDYFEKAKGIEVLLETEVIKINNDNNQVICRNINTNEELILDYDELVIGTGAKPMKAPFPVPETDKISDFHNPISAKLFKQKAQTGQIGSVAIVGAGFIGVELAEAMTGLWGIETHLIEVADRLMPKALDKEISALLEKTLEAEDINIYLRTGVEEIDLNDDDSVSVHLNNSEKINVDHVFICTGIKPNIKLANDAGIEQGELCGIKTTEQMRTSIKNIYAAGDCVVVKDFITGLDAIYPFGSLANRQGRVIADVIAGKNSKFTGAIGTSSVKVFDFIVASSGLNEYQAKILGLDFDCVWGTWYDRPDYMPEYFNLFGKMIYEKGSTRLLGLQLAGKGELTRYIDVFSVLASGHKTAYDLMDYEHAYTPTHSGPINPLNFLGALAVSQEEDSIRSISYKEFDEYEGLILDIREIAEIEEFPCPKPSTNISILDYIEKIKEYDKEQPIIIICQKGPRSYEVARRCKNIGLNNISYLGGGMQLYYKAI